MITALLTVLSVQQAAAQKYTLAVGWRAGFTTGVTAKVVPIDGIAVEGILGLYPMGTSIGGLIEKHSPLFCIKALQTYIGVGAHYRFAYDGGLFPNETFGIVPPPGTRGWGLDAVAGIELKIPLLPIAISAEVKPMVEFTDARAVMYSLDPAFGVKLAF